MPNLAKGSASSSSSRRREVRFVLTDRTNTTGEKDMKKEVRMKFKCKKCPSSFEKKEYLEKHIRDEACVSLELRGPEGVKIRSILKIDPSAPIDYTPPAQNTRSKSTL